MDFFSVMHNLTYIIKYVGIIIFIFLGTFVLIFTLWLSSYNSGKTTKDPRKVIQNILFKTNKRKILKNDNNSTKNYFEYKSFFKILRIITIIVFIIFTLFLFISIPYLFFDALFENISIPFIVILLLLLAPSLIVTIKTTIDKQIKLNKVNNSACVYLRDIPANYSPAILSYLKNQVIEEKKDLVACILNLCAKKVIKISTENNNFKLINLNNSNAISSLTNDEFYLYEMIVNSNNNTIDGWKSIIKKEYSKLRFSKNNKIDVFFLPASIGILTFILMFILLIFGTLFLNPDSFLLTHAPQIMFLGFFLTIESIVIKVIFQLLNKDILFITSSIYTFNGAVELLKWNKFEKFIEEYSKLNEAPIESIEIWEKYLAYSIALNINNNYKDFYDNYLKDATTDNLIINIESYLKNNNKIL